jgi:hypothetical protein
MNRVIQPKANVRAKILMLLLEGLHGKEFVYQLSIFLGPSKATEDLDRDLTSSQQCGIKSVNYCGFLFCVFFLSIPFFFQIVFYKYLYVHMIWVSTNPYITHKEGINAFVNKDAFKYTYIRICDSLIESLL